MEFHADNTTFVSLPSTYQSLYLDCLIKVTRSQQNESLLPAITLPFSNNKSSSLKCRILRLIESKSYGSFANFFIMGIAALLLIISTACVENIDVIVPMSDVIIWRYKVIGDKTYRRKYNSTKKQWIGEWELIP